MDTVRRPARFEFILLPSLILLLEIGRAGPLHAEPPPVPKAEPNETFFSAPTRVRLIAGPWTRLTLLGGEDFAVVAGGGYRVLAGRATLAGVDSSYLRGPTLEFGFRMGS